MSDIPLDDFYRESPRILVALYNNFPRKTTLYVEDIAGPEQPVTRLTQPASPGYFNTIVWLTLHQKTQ